MRFVIITGMSGAGKTQAVHCLEDIGYYCIDNMPPALLSKFRELCSQSQGKLNRVALVMDLRGGFLFEELFGELDSLAQNGYEFEILFLDADDETLVRRYKETRRRHPLSSAGSLPAGVKREREILSEIKQKANYIIDTTGMPSKKLKDKITKIFSDEHVENGLPIDVYSFGFKHGLPIDADLVFDVRFLPNPFYMDELKESTGLDAPVRDFVFGYKQTEEFCQKLLSLLLYLIPFYEEEGKTNLVVAIGCTGGKHRSVAVAQWLFEALEETGHKTSITHRDSSLPNSI